MWEKVDHSMYYVLGTGYNCNRMPKTTVHKRRSIQRFSKADFWYELLQL